MIDFHQDSAEEELKRADHLIYVTLKYVRTAEVIKNAIKRLITAFDLKIIEALEYGKNLKKIKSVPLTPKDRCDTLVKVIRGDEIKAFIEFYGLLKKIDKVDFMSKSEYRKHVTLIAETDERKYVEVNIEELKQYFNKTQDFISFINNWMIGK